jgi:demethylmenaquinone methyltransferase/2-methoxy-6-polyprenyl-1,4-benzoquinol methylase
VVDLCCGAGHNFPYVLAAVGPEGKLIGVDLSENMLARARERVAAQGWNNVTLMLGDASDLGFLLPDSVEVILCSLALSIIPDRVAALKSIKRCLKRNGRLAVIEWKPFSGWRRVMNPLIYISMLPLPNTNRAIFRRASESAELVRQVFPKVSYQEYYGGSLYVVIASS